MRRSTEEIYGTNAEAFIELPYLEALELKKALAQSQLLRVTQKLNRMMAEPGSSREEIMQLVHLQKDISDAVLFNEELIKEIIDKESE